MHILIYLKKYLFLQDRYHVPSNRGASQPYCLIICNTSFHDSTYEERKGADVDFMRMSRLLAETGAIVDIRKNLTAEVIKPIMSAT